METSCWSEYSGCRTQGVTIIRPFWTSNRISVVDVKDSAHVILDGVGIISDPPKFML